MLHCREEFRVTIQIRLELERDAFDRLLSRAVAEQRPVSWQADVLLRRALGLPDAPQQQGGAVAQVTAVGAVSDE